MRYATDSESLRRDTRVEYTKASGPGGQNVNKRETAVRITHFPSGISIRVDETRSQPQNQEIAFIRLKKRLDSLNKPRKRRIKTKVPGKAKLARLESKRTRSKKKQSRQKPALE